MRATTHAQLGVFLTIMAGAGLAYLSFSGFRSEVGQALAVLSQGDSAALRDYILSFGNWAPFISLLLMVLQALAAPLPSFVVTFANGLAFGVWWGWLLSVAGHSLAAAVCFWIARVVGRKRVEALAGRTGLESADRWFARHGSLAILLARLVPGMAFDAVSYAAGLSRMGFWTFMASTIIGTAPQTLLYAYLGQNAPQYIWVLLLVSVAVVAGFAATGLVRRRRGTCAGRLHTRSDASVCGARPERRRGARLPVTGGD
jgi:uncharacterized membrane protein YdjX (TVP38/TMEM64 family)